MSEASAPVRSKAALAAVVLVALTVPHTLFVLLKFGMPFYFLFLQEVLSGAPPSSYKALPRAAAFAFYLGALVWAARAAYRHQKGRVPASAVWTAVAIFAAAFAANIPFLTRG